MSLSVVVVVVDSHCHVHDDVDTEADLCDFFAKSHAIKTNLLVLMGTQPSDWQAVTKLCHDNPNVWPAYGLHPWFAHRFSLTENNLWLSELEQLLQEDQRAVVGEIGLDKAAKTPETQTNEYAQQLGVFRAQVQLAVNYSRPVSIHCVRAFGPLFDMLRDPTTQWPPRIAFHSWSGSPDMIKSFQNLPHLGSRVYFGFSACICLRFAEKTRACIAVVRDDSILLESDQASLRPVQGEMMQMCELVANVKGWTVHQTAEITTRNAHRWLTGT